MRLNMKQRRVVPCSNICLSVSKGDIGKAPIKDAFAFIHYLGLYTSGTSKLSFVFT